MAKENESKPKGTKSSDIQAHLDALLSEDDWSSLPTRQSKEKKARRELKLTRRLRETFAEEPETSDEEEIEVEPEPEPEPVNAEPLLFPYERAAILSALGLTVLAGILIYLMSPLSQVMHYKVVGSESLSADTVLDAAQLKVGQPLLTTMHQADYFSHTAEERNPQIAGLKFELRADNTIEVKVNEIVKVGYVKSNDHYYPILANGKMLKDGEVNQPIGGLPLYDNFKSDSDLKPVLAQFGKLPLALRRSVSEIVWSPTDQNKQRLELFMNDGNEVLISADELASKLKYYPAMAATLDDKKGIADLQVGAYFTPYG
ncbi:cell division protein FtsQ/DivIB [Weissella confusa]|uniref:cell division protein FtsQ/DivIB n=1 Tax=Weissella confusa TaxID=1583 RepID=UPI00107FE8C3|nr:cell division protein FtsQ/DivIB [Weissella confusa]MBJ7651205.1 cell division protein [Weissella confusa]MED4272721.1 cell division protein FtsQ/DivIB [Weissella confusa]QYU57260.1 cell division protein FtsQ/DivIB [Weissella confusa]TGE70555.1 cell division protein [Weissella confusa]